MTLFIIRIFFLVVSMTVGYQIGDISGFGVLGLAGGGILGLS